MRLFGSSWLPAACWPSAMTIITVLLFSCNSEKAIDGFVLVKGGAFKNSKSGYYHKNVMIPDFYISMHEVTQKEWTDVMGTNPSSFRGDNLPVENVSWYDCVEYCNQRSSKEGLQHYYVIDKNKKDANNTNELDDMKWTVTINATANGYRLPTEVEWEYAAGGGQLSKNFTYSGSDSINNVSWYWKNSGDKLLSDPWSWSALEKNNCRPRSVGGKQTNELGIFDMSGNVREWCFDWQVGDSTGNQPGRIWKGGGWIGADFCCEPSFRASFEANGKGPDQGFRICRNK